jgi:hypothetical protein
MHTLIKSGSDKAFTIQKRYRKELGPILEAVNEEEASEEQVDYDSTESDSAATSVRYINPGQGVMALAAPTLQDRMAVDSPVNDSQVEVDGTQEDSLSQVDNPSVVETNTDTGNNVSLHQAGGGLQPSRMSSRIISQDLHSIKISDKAVKNAAARDVSGLHGEKDAEDLRLGADGLLANTQNVAAGTQNRPPPVQRPLMIREARSANVDEDDMEEDDC